MIGLAVAACVPAHVPSKERQRVANLTCVLGIAAVVFWCWAVWNCTQAFDFGVITFALVLAMCVLGWQAAKTGSPRTARAFTWGMPAACVAVAAIYMAYLYWMPKPWTLPLYYFVAAVWWLCAAVIAWLCGGDLAAELHGLSEERQGLV